MDYYVIEYVLAQDSEGFASSNATRKTVNESQMSAVIRNLLPGATYKFRVAMMNNHGASQFSECGIFQTLGESIYEFKLHYSNSTAALVLHGQACSYLHYIFLYSSRCSNKCFQYVMYESIYNYHNNCGC